jgi:hypothetical protein
MITSTPSTKRGAGLLVDVYVNANYGAVHNF